MNVGGTARYVSELVKEIPNSKLATGFVQGFEIEDPSLGRLEIVRIPHLGREISPIKDFRAWLELRRVIRQLKPAIVHTHTFKAGLIGRTIPGDHVRIHTFHGHLFDDRSFSAIQKRIIERVEKFLAGRTDLIISVGEKVGEEIRGKGIGLNRHWISIAPGVKQLPQIEKFQARRNLGLTQNGILIGWMARMAEVKNPFLFLEIASKLQKISFVMAGGGDLLEEVKAIAPENVSVIGWADAATFWSAVDFAVSTSNNEGMPISLIEAQMAGLPVVATNVGSTTEVIENGITGYVTANDLGQLLPVIRKLLLDRKLINSLGKNAKKRSTSEFRITKMINAHKSAYLGSLK